MNKTKKALLGTKYKTETMRDVSFLLGYGFNGSEVAKMMGVSTQTVKTIRVQLRHIYKIRDSHKIGGKE